MSYIGNPIISTDFPKDTFSGNGSTTAFTMSLAPASVNAVIVVVSGITQDPSTYTISGTTLTFSAAPPTGTSNISVRHLGVAGIPNTPSAGSVVTASIVDANVTQAKLASGIASTGPAFSAYQSAAQTISNNTQTKVQCNTEEFDTNLNYDNATNYRFTPTIAGYYQVSGEVCYLINAATSTLCDVSIWKNGSRFKQGTTFSNNTGGVERPTVSALIYFNGSTDYVEFYTYQNSGGSTNLNSSSGIDNYFQAAMVRSA